MNQKKSTTMWHHVPLQSLYKAKTLLLNALSYPGKQTQQRQDCGDLSCDRNEARSSVLNSTPLPPHLKALRELCQIDREEESYQPSRYWSWGSSRFSEESFSDRLKNKVDVCWQQLNRSSIISQLVASSSKTTFRERASSLRFEHAEMANVSRSELPAGGAMWQSRSNISEFSVVEEQSETKGPFVSEHEQYSHNYSIFVEQSTSFAKSVSMYNCQTLSQTNTRSSKMSKRTPESEARCFANICLQYFVESKQLRFILSQLNNIPNTKRKVYARISLKHPSKSQTHRTQNKKVTEKVAKFFTEIFFVNWTDDDLSEVQLSIRLYKKKRFNLGSKFLCGATLALGDLDIYMDTTMRVGLHSNRTQQQPQSEGADFEILSQDRSIRADAVAALRDDGIRHSNQVLRRTISLPATTQYRLW